MLVVDKVNDRVLLSRQSRYAPRMWSCLAGFAEVGHRSILIVISDFFFLGKKF